MTLKLILHMLLIPFTKDELRKKIMFSDWK